MVKSVGQLVGDFDLIAGPFEQSGEGGTKYGIAVDDKDFVQCNVSGRVLRLGKGLRPQKIKGCAIPAQARELLDNSRDSGYTGRPKKTGIYAEQRGIKGRCVCGH